MASITLEKIMADRATQDELVKVMGEIKSNMEWIDKHMKGLVRIYPDTWIAVSNKEVIDSDKDIIELMKRVKSKYNGIPADMRMEYINPKKFKYLF